MAAPQENQHEPDHWSSEAYKGAASFVPALTTKVLQYLDPQGGEDILDIGCGDGVLTAKIAPLCHSITGLDSSKSFIQSATESVTPYHPNVQFYEHDCRRLSPVPPASCSHILVSSTYHKIFSNAAMHWILRDEVTRTSFFTDVLRPLKLGGTFVFEMGGAGNVAEVHAAIVSVLHHAHGIPLQQLREADPWFFPSQKWMETTLRGAGFVVEKVETEYRRTRLTPETADGGGGLPGWVRLMGARFLDCLEDEEQGSKAVRDICGILENVLERDEEGCQWLGYVRLRGVAWRPG